MKPKDTTPEGVIEYLTGRAQRAADEADALAKAAIALGGNAKPLYALTEWRHGYGQSDDALVAELRRELSGVQAELENARAGEAIPTMLRVAYTPDAIRDHFENDESELAELVLAANADVLVQIGEACVEDDRTWRTYHEVLSDACVAALLPMGPTASEAGPIERAQWNGEMPLDERIRRSAAEFGDPFTIGDMADHVGGSKTSVGRLMRKLADEGALVRTGGQRGATVRYQVAP